MDDGYIPPVHQSNITEIEDKFKQLEQLVFRQSDKIIDLAFGLYRTQAFLDYVMDKQNIVPDEDMIREFADIALERVKKDFPRMTFEIKDPE